MFVNQVYTDEVKCQQEISEGQPILGHTLFLLSCFGISLFAFPTVWEIKFHSQNPDNLFMCSEDGSLWHWDGTSLGMSRVEAGCQFGTPGYLPGAIPNSTGAGVGLDATSPWLSVDATKHKLETYSLLPHN